MEKGNIHIFTGDGSGKSAAALGQAVHEAELGRRVIIIQFLKGKGIIESEFIKRLEPEIKLFRFEKSDENFEELTEERKKEEIYNIQNGINFAKKVLSTGECELLVLDEVLGILDNGIISTEDIKAIAAAKSEEASVIMTGIHMQDEVYDIADEISRISCVDRNVK